MRNVNMSDLISRPRIGQEVGHRVIMAVIPLPHQRGGIILLVSNTAKPHVPILLGIMILVIMVLVFLIIVITE